MPDTGGGRLVSMSGEHEAQIIDFLTGFISDCFPERKTKIDTVQARARRLITEQKGYLWENQAGEIVSMAAVVRESPNTTSISLVYTPPAYRGRGYAANVVAALSHEQIRQGKQACNLHTNMENSTSNGVYIRLGYTLIGESVRVRLGST